MHTAGKFNSELNWYVSSMYVLVLDFNSSWGHVIYVNVTRGWELHLYTLQIFYIEVQNVIDISCLKFCNIHQTRV